MASLFKSLSDDMERVAQAVEEGAKILMGTATQMGEHDNDDPAAPMGSGDAPVHDFGDEDSAFIMDEDEQYGSPLMGMADSVLSDIMSAQVRH